MKKNQIFTPGPRWWLITASPLPFENSGAIGCESRPVGPTGSSFQLRRKAAFRFADSASRSLMRDADLPASLYLGRKSSSTNLSMSFSSSPRDMPQRIPSGTSLMVSFVVGASVAAAGLAASFAGFFDSAGADGAADRTASVPRNPNALAQ